MTRLMEINKKIPLLFLFLALLNVQIIRMEDCPRHQEKNLICYNDYRHNITCMWNGTHELPDTNCTLHTKRVTENKRLQFEAVCYLQSVNNAGPGCSLLVAQKKIEYIFSKDETYSINLTCNHGKQILTMSYKPVCHIKMPPPGKPQTNLTTVSWNPQVVPHRKIKDFICQLQWKKKDQSWIDPSVKIKHIECKDSCKAELDPDSLIQGETYEAHVRVKSAKGNGAWSDWGPTASWTSHVGKPKPPLLSGVFGSVLAIIITGTVFALSLAVILLRNEKTTWVYKKIRGLPLPDPGQSSLKEANVQNWSWPHVTGQLFHFSLIPDDIAPVEVTSTVEKLKSENNLASTSSSFSNPCYPESFSSLSTDNVLPRPPNTPNVSVDGQRNGKTAEEAREDENKKKLEIQQLLSKENNSEPVQVISDYERVERPPVEDFNLQSPDSGMCSGEEASQESLEADSTCLMDEKSGDKEQEREERTEKVDFKKLFGGSGNIFGKGSIQICSDYEKIPMLNPGSPELSSVDSGVCTGGEEQASHEEIQEDFDKSTEPTRFQFLALQLPSPSHIKEMIAPITMSMSMEPSDDGYMPS